MTLKNVLRAGLAPALAAGLAVGLVACGGDMPGPTPLPAPTPTPAPRKASVAMSLANATVGVSPRAGFRYRLEFDVTVRESAGVGADLNFLRVDFLDANGGLLERQEAGANRLSRLPAGGTLADHAVVDFNTGGVAVALVSLNLTDDGGNTQEAQVRIRFV
jgi:hypothetical protein